MGIAFVQPFQSDEWCVLQQDDDEDADEPEDDSERLQQEMGDVGEGADVVDQRLWGDQDKPEEGQEPGTEKYERDAPVQAMPHPCHTPPPPFCLWKTNRFETLRGPLGALNNARTWQYLTLMSHNPFSLCKEG